MEYFNEDNIYQILKSNILAIPGVVVIDKNDNSNLIDINKNNFYLIIDININCFSYVNIWAVMCQVQNQVHYIIENNDNYKKNIKVNVRVFDLVEENNID